MTIRPTALAALTLALAACTEDRPSRDAALPDPAPVTPAEVLPPATPVIVQDRFSVSRSEFDATATLARLFEALDRRELQVFAVIDHAAAAQEADSEMPFSTLVIFGNPEAGTPLMRAVPLMGAELPLRALVYEQQGEVFVAVTGTDNLARQYPLEEQSEILARVGRTLDDIRAEVSAG